MFGEVAPLLHKKASFVSKVLVVDNVIELPEQIEFAPVIVGVVGNAFTVTVIVLLTADVQPVAVFLTLNE